MKPSATVFDKGSGLRMNKLLRVLAVALLLILAVLRLMPSPIDPVVWEAPPAPALAGPYASNEALKPVQKLLVGIGIGPEGLAIDAEGAVYTGSQDGRIVRLSPAGDRYREIAQTGGRPLGMVVDPDGSLIVADSGRGLLRVGADGASTVLSHTAGGIPQGFTDDVGRDPGSRVIWFSDASTKFPNPHYLLDLLEHRPHGRLIAHDLDSGISSERLSGLYFANGVTVGPDAAWVLVAETAAYRITRYWLKGDKAGTREVFVDNLPGFPDNISFNGRDRIWVALPVPRDAALDGLSQWPSLRRMLANLPAPIRALLGHQRAPHAFVLGFDLDGRLIANLQYRGSDAFAPIMSVKEHGPWLYFGSLSQNAIGRLPLQRVIAEAAAPPAGWEQAPATPERER